MNEAEIAAPRARRKREPISKRLRFEILKRDGFACRYCGATAPGVVLEIDHVVAVADGGETTAGNLVTACFECNRGKSAVPLGAVLPSMEALAIRVVKREAEIAEQAAIIRSEADRIEGDVMRVARVLWGDDTEDIYDDYRVSLTRFVTRLNPESVVEAARMARARVPCTSRAWKYFCGVCWNRIREVENVD